MLIRKCEETVGKLLSLGDFNVRVTLANELSTNPRFLQKSLVEGQWKEYIRDSLGGGVINDERAYEVTVLICKNGEVTKSTVSNLNGNMILTMYWELFKEAEGIRIEIKSSTNQTRTWIIAR